MRLIKSITATGTTPKTYNVAVFFPAGLMAEIAGISFLGRLEYTRHALGELLSDKYGEIAVGLLPRNVTMSEWDVIEAEVTGQYLTKVVIRKPFDSTRSIALVIMPLEKAVVKTCWINQNTDNHRTLKTDNYATA